MVRSAAWLRIMAMAGTCSAGSLAVASGDGPPGPWLEPEAMAATSFDGRAESSVIHFDEVRTVTPDVLEQILGRPLRPRSLRSATCDVVVSVQGGVDGDNPVHVTHTADGSLAIITNLDTDNIVLFDVATGSVVQSVPVGDQPFSSAATPNGQYILTANFTSNDVTVLDATTRALVTTIPMPVSGPFRVRVTGDSSHAVVACQSTNVATAAFAVIDLSTLTVARTIPAVLGAYGFHGNTSFPINGVIWGDFQIAPDNSTIIVPIGQTISGSPAHRVEFHNLLTGALINSASMTHSGYQLAVARTANQVAVAMTNRPEVPIFNIAAGTLNRYVTAPFSVPNAPAINSAATRLAVANTTSTAVIDLTTDTSLGTVATTNTQTVVISPDESTFFANGFQARSIDAATGAAVGSGINNIIATYDTVASPTAARAVGLNNRFSEDVNFYSTPSGTPVITAVREAGPPPEGDYPYEVAISPNGQLAVVGMGLSGNTAIIDLQTQTLRSLVPTGEYVNQVGVTPDGQFAVTCDRDSSTISVINLSTDTVVRQLSASTRPSQLEISSDGTKAYVFSIAGTDTIHHVNLAGAASSIAGTTPGGAAIFDGGGAFGYFLSETTGIALSPNGATLAVFSGQNDRVFFIDTATRSILTFVTAGDYPIRGAFTPNGAKLYVTNTLNNTVTVFNVNGASSSLAATIPLPQRPLCVVADRSGGHVYVTDTAANSSMYVIDTTTDAIVQTLPLGGGSVRDAAYAPLEDRLYTVNNDPASLVRVTLNGASSSVLDTTPRISNTNGMSIAYNQTVKKAVVSLPFLDAVEILCFAPSCPPDFNGSGTVTVQDIFDFLAAYFAGNPSADFNGAGGVTVQDIFDFLAAYFTGCT